VVNFQGELSAVVAMRIGQLAHQTWQCDFLILNIWSQNADVFPTNLGVLEEAIRHFAINMDRNMIQRAFQGMIRRVNKCINGSTFSDK